MDQVTDFNGKTTGFGYDDNSNETSTCFDTNTSPCTPSATGTNDQLGYTNTDTISSIAYKTGSTTNQSLTYTPDNANQLAAMSQTGLPGNTSETYGYDHNERLSSVTANSTQSTYNYSSADTLTKQLDGTQQVFDPAGELCYTAPAGITTTGCTTPGQNVPAGATGYTYDANGNRTAKQAASGPGSSYSYDQANRMTSATVPNTSNFNSGQYSSVAATNIYAGTGVSGTVQITVAGQGGIPSGASAVALNLAVSSASGAGTATVYRANGTLPTTPNATFDGTHAASNLVVTQLGSLGAIKVALSAGVTAAVTVTVEGWYSTPFGASGTVFTPSDPTTVLSTGPPLGTTGACSPSPCATLPAGGSLTFQVTGHAGVPTTGVSAVALNLVALNATSTGFLYAYPAGSTLTNGMAIHNGTAAGAEMDFVPVSSSGQITLMNFSSSSTDVLGSIEGWLSNGTSGGDVYTPTDPVRVMDTATGTGQCTPSCAALGTNTSITARIAGLGGVPATGVAAVMANITVTAPAGVGGLLATQASTDPTATGIDMIIAPGQTTSLNTVVPLGTDGAVKLGVIYNAGPINISIDVQGWYTPADVTWTYNYDPDGLRATKTSPAGATTSYAWNRTTPIPQLLSETTAGTTLYYLYGPDGLVFEQLGGSSGPVASSALYYHHDQLGSTRTVTNSTGTTVLTVTYNPYGQLTAFTGTTPVNILYAGYYYDWENGLDYVVQRYYDPATGQFTRQDPLAPLTRSAYAYATGNPGSFVDPSGLWRKKLAVVVTVVGVGVCIGASLGACGIATGVAFGFRTYARFNDGDPLSGTIMDGLFTAASFGLVEVPSSIALEPETTIAVNGGEDWVIHGMDLDPLSKYAIKSVLAGPDIVAAGSYGADAISGGGGGGGGGGHQNCLTS